MASKAHSNRMKRLESKKSHSWWWDSHISPKNSKWLQENLEEMDQYVKRMLKLIEEDADSFAKKAEMYYRKRPELVSLVEQFYRMYRSLAERYDNVTGELRKTVSSDLRSQGSGVSDVGSDQSMPSPDRRPAHGKSGPRAAGFDVFLGGGGSSADLYNKREESSTSESDSDDSSVNIYNAFRNNAIEQELRRKNSELETELRRVKDISAGYEKSQDENSQILAKIAACEEELRTTKEKMRQSEEEIARMTVELQKYENWKDSSAAAADPEVLDSNSSTGRNQVQEIERSTSSRADDSDSVNRIQALEEELRTMQEKLRKSDDEVHSLRQELENTQKLIQNLQDQLKSAQEDASDLQNKIEKQRIEVSELKEQVTICKTCISDRDKEIEGLKESLYNADKNLSDESKRLQDQIAKMSSERTHLDSTLKDLESRCESLEQDLRRVNDGKDELEGILHRQIDQLKADVTESNDRLEELNKIPDMLRLEHDSAVAEKDGQIDQLRRHLHQLHIEHVRLIDGSDKARKSAEELRSTVQELEREVRMRQEMILEGAEEKREAIRQLCFTLEHYRSGYHQLRRAVFGHKRFPVMAS